MAREGDRNATISKIKILIEKSDRFVEHRTDSYILQLPTIWHYNDIWD